MLKYEKVLNAIGLSFNPSEIRTLNDNDQLTKKTLSSKTNFLSFDKKIFSSIQIYNELDKFYYSLSITLNYFKKDELNFSNLKNIDFQVIQDYLKIEKIVFNKHSFTHILLIDGLFDEINNNIINQNYVINCYRYDLSKKFRDNVDNLINDIDSKLKSHGIVYSKDRIDEIITIIKILYY